MERYPLFFCFPASSSSLCCIIFKLNDQCNPILSSFFRFWTTTKGAQWIFGCQGSLTLAFHIQTLWPVNWVLSLPTILPIYKEDFKTYILTYPQCWGLSHVVEHMCGMGTILNTVPCTAESLSSIKYSSSVTWLPPACAPLTNSSIKLGLSIWHLRCGTYKHSGYQRESRGEEKLDWVSEMTSTNQERKVRVHVGVH